MARSRQTAARKPLHSGPPITMPLRMPASMFAAITAVERRVEITSNASDVVRRASGVVPPLTIWRGLRWLGANVGYSGDSATQRFRRTAAELAKSLRVRATKLFAQVPPHQLWEDGDVCGEGVRVVRVLEQAANEIESMFASSTRKKRGPTPRFLSEWTDVQATLAASGFDFGDLADLVLRSGDDWSIPPCPELVGDYQRAGRSGDTGRERLKKMLKAIRRRTGPRKGVRVMYRIPVEFT